MYIETINSPEDVKKLTIEELPALAEEMRHALLTRASRHGGHFGPNFGMVEATIAMHYVFESPKDKIVYDVSHQSYPHKMLTGRKDAYLYEEHYDDVSGYTNPHESEHDFFTIGHTSTSVSLACGLAKARDLKGEDGNVIAVIGDGSLSGGEALEGIDYAAELGGNLIIVVNDNDMSIAENHGGLYQNLKLLRETNGTAPCNLFKAMGLDYIYVNQGNDTKALVEAFQKVKNSSQPVVVHINTLKGKGYEPAEKNPAAFHGVSPFDIKTGRPVAEKKYPTYTDVFSKKLCQLGETHPELVAVTAAMPDGTGVAAFGKRFPDRFFDVGIAEAHAVTSAAGMAAAGLRPVVAVYSSFLQRGYDQILHDVCIQNLPVIFAVDRAGLVGSDGETHQGIFDYSYLTSIPNMSVAAPKNLWELRAMLDFAMDYKAPFAIRYPRGTAYRGLKEFMQPISYGKGEMLYEEEDIALLAVGSMVSTGEHVREKLKEEGYSCTLANARFVKPFDKELVERLAKNHRLIVTMEENVLQGGFGLPVTAYIHEHYPQVKVLNIALPDAYVEHGNVSVLREGLGIDSDSIIRKLKTEGWL